jgi:hypothetical protein
MNVLTNEDWNSFSELTRYRTAFKLDGVSSNNYFHFPQFIDIIENSVKGEEVWEKSQICYHNYERILKNKINSLDNLIDIALETWLKRLETQPSDRTLQY